MAYVGGAHHLRVTFGCSGQAASRLSDRLKMSLVEITNFHTSGKAHTVAKPVETIGQDNFTLRTFWHVRQVDSGDNTVTNFEIDLIGMRKREDMWFPRGCHR